MKLTAVLASVFGLTAATLSQNIAPVFKVDARSALIWDHCTGETSECSIVRDPATGAELHRLTHGGIEITSRVGYESVHANSTAKLLIYTTIVTNNTDADVYAEYGGASVDSRSAPPLWLVQSEKEVPKRRQHEAWEVGKMQCFTAHFGSSENIFSSHEPARRFMIRPGTAITISSVTQDPDSVPVLCSLDGCHIKGTIRYCIEVNETDYIFVWPGSQVAYCGP